MGFFLILIAWAFVGAPSARADITDCNLRLAEHLLYPPRLQPPDETRTEHRHVTARRFAEMADRLRPVDAKFRQRRYDGQKEVTLRLNQRARGMDHLWTLTLLVVPYHEERVRYDRVTGAVDGGPMEGEVLRPGRVSLRFELSDAGEMTRDHLRQLHELIIPEVRRDLDLLNAESETRFGRRLIGPLEQGYPGEYGAEFAPGLTAAELGFLIAGLGDGDV